MMRQFMAKFITKHGYEPTEQVLVNHGYEPTDRIVCRLVGVRAMEFVRSCGKVTRKSAR